MCCPHCVLMKGRDIQGGGPAGIVYPIRGGTGFHESPFDILRIFSFDGYKRRVALFTAVTFRISIYAYEMSLFSYKALPAYCFSVWRSSRLKKKNSYRPEMEAGNKPVSRD